MSKPTTLPRAEIERLDQIYREGGLRVMASPHVHYDDPTCPHPGCRHRMDWIDFEPGLHGDPEGLYKPLVRAWWERTGFAGHCPSCGGWVRFSTLGMTALNDDDADRLPNLPANWADVAQFG